MGKKTTLDDIAREAGVSKNTVSLVLRDLPGVSDAVKERVIQLARSMNYEKRPQMADVRRKLKYILVLMPFSLQGHYAYGPAGLIPRLYFQLQTCAQKRGCVILTHQLTDEQESALAIPDVARDMPIEGIVTFGCISSEYILCLKKAGYHVVTLHQYYDGLDVDAVTSDEAHAGFVMTRHLIQMGHKKIVYMGEKYYMSKYMERWYGYCRAMSQYGLPFENVPYSETPVRWQNEESERELIANTLRNFQEMPTAMVCGEDFTATRIANCLKEMGYTIPEDMSLVSFDDVYVDLSTEIPLTTYRVDHQELAQSALDLLLEPSRTSRRVEIYGKIVFRDSVRSLSPERDAR